MIQITKEDLRQMGRDAESMKDCPYTFARAGVSQEQYDIEVKPLFNEWWVGFRETHDPQNKWKRRLNREEKDASDDLSNLETR